MQLYCIETMNIFNCSIFLKALLSGDILENLRFRISDQWKESSPKIYFGLTHPKISTPEGVRGWNALSFSELPFYFLEFSFSFPELSFYFPAVHFCFPEVLFFQKCPIVFPNIPSNFSLYNSLENAVFEPLENFSEGSALSTLQGGL